MDPVLQCIKANHVTTQTLACIRSFAAITEQQAYQHVVHEPNAFAILLAAVLVPVTGLFAGESTR